jgi:hypothetical protein
MFFLGMLAMFAGAVLAAGGAAWGLVFSGGKLVVIIGLSIMLVHAVMVGVGAYLRR